MEYHYNSDSCKVCHECILQNKSLVTAAAPRGSRDRDREALSEDFQIGTGTSVSSSENAASATNDNPSDRHAASSCLMDEREASQANDMLPLQSAERASHAASSEFSKGNQGNIHDIEGDA